MDQRRIAKQILRFLDPEKRKSSLRFLVVLLVVSLCGMFWANQWESALAVIPRSFCSIMVGYLMVYIQSVRLYPRIAHYFDRAVLMRDAGSVPVVPPPVLPRDHREND